MSKSQSPWIVDVTRTYVFSGTVEIPADEARDATEAEALAMDRIGSTELKMKEAIDDEDTVWCAGRK